MKQFANSGADLKVRLFLEKLMHHTSAKEAQMSEAGCLGVLRSSVKSKQNHAFISRCHICSHSSRLLFRIVKYESVGHAVRRKILKCMEHMLIAKSTLGERMNFAVEVTNLAKIYESKVRALDGVDLGVETGKVFALLGPNGAGKTTLMRILTTQLKPTSGEAYVFGLDVVRKDSEVRRIVGYIPQEMSVWTDITGFENLLIYAKIYGVPPQQEEKNNLGSIRNYGFRRCCEQCR